MKEKKNDPVYSGASPVTVENDLRSLIDFQEEGIKISELKKLINKCLVPHLLKYDSPAFQSMFNCFPETGAETGAKIALSFNQGVTNWQVSPGAVMLEELCCKKLCQLYKLSPESDATFMYCGTYANQQALYLALHKKAELFGFDLAETGLMGFPDPSNLVVLTSKEAHFSIKHAVRIMGLGENCIIPVDVDKNQRMSINHLKATVSDLQGKKDIVCIVSTAGTTSTGTVDPIIPVAEICDQSKAWFHLDAAYGLAYCLIPEYESLFNGKELADSITWDPHKQFGVPIPNSLLFVKNRKNFSSMFLFGNYFNREEDTEPNPGLKSPPTTRPFTALPLVTTIRYQGFKNLIRRLKAPLSSIRSFFEIIRNEKDIETGHYPDLGIQCFRVVPENLPDTRINELQNYIHKSLFNEGKRTLSITSLDNKTYLRLVAISPPVTLNAMKDTLSSVRKITEQFISTV